MSARAILLGGPTACGKSGLACALAQEFDGVVINADSMQVYRELRVLTARPTDADEARVPHRLYGVLTAAEACSAARWRSLALTEMDAAWRAGRMPILVGGSGLYFRALTRGLAPIPTVPEPVRRAARARHTALGGTSFFAELAERDPETAARLSPGDRQRLIRAWEVIESTGVSLSEWQRRRPASTDLEYLALFLVPAREELYRACDRRFSAMVASGVLDEVAALADLGLDPELPAMKALGMRPLRRHLAGETGLESAVAEGMRETRRYAKRQLTWFRHQMAEATTLNAPIPPPLEPRIVDIARQFMLTEEK